jgi:tetratricopeptide (TPR) repeat protein
MRWPRRRPHRRDSAPATKSRVVLVHGLGGTGKSRLLTQFRGIVDGDIPGSPVSESRIRSVWLDWEDERRDQPDKYVGLAGPSLVTVLDALQNAVTNISETDARALERAHQAFLDYRQGAARMPEYAARFADVLAQSRQAESPFTPQDAVALLKSAASAGLVLGGHPGGVLGLTPEQLAASGEAGAHLSKAAARAVTGKKTGEMSPEEYALVTDPVRELTRRVASAIRTLADEVLLVIMLDTGEVIGDDAWGWLRRVMTHTGPRVIWVIGARFETEAEAGFDSPVARFVREIGDEYLVLMSPTRFDDDMIRTYLKSELKRANGVRPSKEPTYTDQQIDLIARFTRGLPLAVSLVAELLGEGEPAENICHEVDDGYPSNVVSRLARRYLVHTEQQTYQADDPRRDDVTKILGLALAFGGVRRDPELLAALWNVPDPLIAFQDLARRHDFVLPVSRRLHDDVRDTLRTDLLDPFRRVRARTINQRATDLFSTRLQRIRSRRPTLDEQLDSIDFKTALLAWLWHTIWIDNQVGLDLFIDILPVLAVADPATADTATAIMDRFADTFDDIQRRDLDLFTSNAPASALDELLSSRENTLAPARRVKLTVDGLAMQRPTGRDMAYTSIGELADRQSAVLILQAELQAQNRVEKAEAIAKLRAAATLTSSTRLRQAIGSRAADIASELVWAGHGGTSVPTRTGLAASKLATEILTDNASAWRCYAAALRRLNRYEEALTAYDKAIALDPNESYAYSSKGGALCEIGRYQEALAVNDKAISINPHNNYAYTGRGDALYDMVRHEEALAAYDKAISIDPSDPSPYNGMGAILRDMGRYEEALAACDKAISINPDDIGSYSHRGTVLRYMGRFEEALAAHDKAITLLPHEAYLYTFRGNTLHCMGRFEEALAAHDKAISINPNYIAAYDFRAITLVALGRYEEALVTLDKVITLAPDDVSGHVNKGIVLTVMGDLDGAFAEFDIVDRLDSDGEGEAWVWTGAILWHKGEEVKARDQFARVKGHVRGCPPFETAELEAVALCGLGQADTAERHLLEALPTRFRGDQGSPLKLYALLSAPPLPGVDRLRKIVESNP